MPRLSDPVTVLPGVGPTRAALYEKLGIRTVAQLLRHFPTRYEDRRAIRPIAQIREGETVCVRAIAAAPPRSATIRRGFTIAKGKIFDETGVLSITFFNRKYSVASLRQGEEYVFFGRVERARGGLTLLNPDFERAGAETLTGRLLPVYPLTAGLSRNMVLKNMAAALPAARFSPDPLPGGLRAARGLPAPADAYAMIHRPDCPEDAETARAAFCYEELLLFCLRLGLVREKRKEEAGLPFRPVDAEKFYAALPFAPTGAQRRAIADCLGDMSSGGRMCRLVQGDVGSGKTAVAAALIWAACQNGCQSALMAPTEILARQHFLSLSPLMEGLGLRCALLTGRVAKKEREALLASLKAGEIDLLLGTHALLTGDVDFRKLGLVVLDEQHRFGVAQRMELNRKGARPHTLVLSATPIPRTLALILYGELELSVLDELPPGRQKVDTFLVGEEKRDGMYRFLRSIVKEGGRGYLVCPAIGGEEEDEESAMKEAVREAKRLQTEVFSDLRCALLHGKMRPADKAAAMDAFARGETDLLISTTVIEVGVDVPEARFIVIENADRFGLSSLHQLRGRVGRGPGKSYCFLMGGRASPEAKERLRLLTRVSDGFKIAEADLKNRGPGDFFGTRQHGLFSPVAAGLLTDPAFFSGVRSDADRLLADDPALDRAENAPLRDALREREEQAADMMN